MDGSVLKDLENEQSEYLYDRSVDRSISYEYSSGGGRREEPTNGEIILDKRG